VKIIALPFVCCWPAAAVHGSAAERPQWRAQVGAVASLNRPGGNVTGIASMGTELGAKRLALMHDLLPIAARFGALINSNPGMSAEATTADLKSAACAIGREIEIINIFTALELDKAFESLLRSGGDFHPARSRLGDLDC
jgi:ABC-type uncharacterized transport system substrate-binding protein